MSNVWLCLYGKWIKLQPELLLVPGQTPFSTSPGITCHRGMVKDTPKDTGGTFTIGKTAWPSYGTEKAGPDGPMASALVTTHQRGGKILNL